MSELVHLRSVSRRYEAAAPPALDRVTVTVQPGEAVAVMGPSGSGKSTLLHLIGGLDRPDGGAVVVAGVELTRLSERGLALFRRRQVGIIFQFFHLLDDLTVRDNVLLPAQLAGTPNRIARIRANDLLESLGIAEKANAYPAHLSGGQRQRVAIARALINRPALLLADEPTGAVDARAGNNVIDLLRDLNRSGQTLVMVTHDAALAARSAGSVIELCDGRITGATR